MFKGFIDDINISVRDRITAQYERLGNDTKALCQLAQITLHGLSVSIVTGCIYRIDARAQCKFKDPVYLLGRGHSIPIRYAVVQSKLYSAKCKLHLTTLATLVTTASTSSSLMAGNTSNVMRSSYAFSATGHNPGPVPKHLR